MNEDVRRRLTTVLAWVSWFIAMSLTTTLTVIAVVQPPTAIPTDFQRVGGALVITFIGVGIAAGNRLGRLRSTGDLIRVFQEGYRAGAQNGKGDT